MTDKDLLIAVTGLPPMGVASKKPPHLILLEDGKNKAVFYKMFITTDKPDMGTNGFVQAKGIFVNIDEAKIAENFSELLTSAKKEEFMEMMFPIHKVVHIRNLVFKAK